MWKGDKYDATKSLALAVVAKLIRSDIAAAVKSGALPSALKARVRIQRYSMGQSVNVTLTMPVTLNRSAWELRCGALEHARWTGESRHTSEADSAVERVTHIVNAYNWDDSDISSDYFSCHFYAHITLDDDDELNALRAELCAADSTANPQIAPTPLAPIPRIVATTGWDD